MRGVVGLPVPAPRLLYTTCPGLGRATDAAGPIPLVDTTRPGLGRATDAARRIPLVNTTSPGAGRATDAAGRIPDSRTDAPGAGAAAPRAGAAAPRDGWRGRASTRRRVRMGHDRGTAYDSHRQGQDQSIAHPALPCDDELRFAYEY